MRHHGWAVLFLAALLSTGGLVRYVTAAEPGFQALFNGRDLSGWDGDPKIWSVRDGAIHGETSLGRLAFRNTFCIWRGGTLKDFELKLKFRIFSGNSGVQYRSRDLGSWRVAGYQAEIVNQQGKVGFLYEEKGRGWLADVGERVEIDASGKRSVVGVSMTKEDLMRSGYYRDKEWNEYRIVAKGPHIVHFLNGFQTAELTDNDPARRALEGILALQIHAGPPMVVEFTDILLKTL